MDTLRQYEEVFATNFDFTRADIQNHIVQLKQLDQLLPPSSTFLMITNTVENKYEFISRNFEFATGLDRKPLMENGIPHFLSLIHPEEIKLWLDMLREQMDFCLDNFKIEERYKLDFQYNYRIRKQSGTYINILENQLNIMADREGKPVVGLGHFTVFGDGENIPIRATIRFLNDRGEYETVFQKIYGPAQIGETLTNRERDVLRLIAVGLTNEQISKKLNISKHTVITHRKNMLEKSNSRNTAQLLVECIREGWL
jgi:DNA-binding CsgD family transcriptional regulator